MTKQTKLIKFMLFVLLLIPVVLFAIAIIQTFVIKSEQNKLINAQRQLELKQQEYQSVNNQHKYVFKDKNTTNGELVLTEEYQKELYKHKEYFEEKANQETGETEQVQIYYGDNTDTKIIINNQK